MSEIIGLRAAAEELGISHNRLRRVMRDTPEDRRPRRHPSGGHPAYSWSDKKRLETWFWYAIMTIPPREEVISAWKAAKILYVKKQDVVSHIAALRKAGLKTLLPGLASPKVGDSGKEFRPYYWDSPYRLVHWWRVSHQRLAEGEQVEEEEEEEEVDESPQLKLIPRTGEIAEVLTAPKADKKGMHLPVNDDTKKDMELVYSSLSGLAQFIGQEVSYEEFVERLLRSGLESVRKDIEKAYKPLMPKAAKTPKKPRSRRGRKPDALRST